MNIRRALSRLAAAALIAVGGVAVVQAPALAASVALPAGVAGGASYTFDAAAGTLSLTVRSENLATGYCLTLFLDPARASGSGGTEGSHYDIRAVRTCRDYTSRSSGIQYEEATYGVNITGINKLFTCYGPLNQAGTCRNTIGSAADVNHNFNSHMTCNRAWTRAASNDIFYFDGGDPTECNG